MLSGMSSGRGQLPDARQKVARQERVLEYVAGSYRGHKASWLEKALSLFCGREGNDERRKKQGMRRFRLAGPG